MQSPLETLHEYYATFSTLNLKAISAFFTEPFLSTASQGVFSAADRSVLEKAFGPMVETLRSKGYGHSEFVTPEVIDLGSSASLIRGVAVRYTTSGEVMERIPIGYLMHRGPSGWKIAAMVLP
jgi:hypothetical protein